MVEPTPDPDLIYDLTFSIFRPQLLRLAILLDVFSPLAAGPADAETVRMQIESQVVFWDDDLFAADLGQSRYEAVLCG